MRKLSLTTAMFVYIFLLQTNETFGQMKEIIGTVFNAETGSPISGVKIVVKGTTILTESDKMVTIHYLFQTV